MAGRAVRALRRMTDASTMSWWRPQGFDTLVALPAVLASTSGEEAPTQRDGSSADLRDRQRDLAFDMYAEALVRLADEDAAAHLQERRETA